MSKGPIVREVGLETEPVLFLNSSHTYRVNVIKPVPYSCLHNTQ